MAVTVRTMEAVMAWAMEAGKAAGKVVGRRVSEKAVAVASVMEAELVAGETTGEAWEAEAGEATVASVVD